MKKKIIILLLSLLMIGFILTLYTVKYINSLIASENDGLERVKRNNIVKAAENYLENGKEEEMLQSLKDYQADITIYSPDGIVLYDSAANARTGQKEDINKTIEEAGLAKLVYIIRYTTDQGAQSALALITKQVPDLADSFIKNAETADKVTAAVWLLAAGFALFLITVFVIIYWYVLHPFQRLEGFAAEVAKGNLDAQLSYPRQNIFGAFSWAFDLMRKELKSSNEKRDEAEKAKKELVAVLSHDIRTPVSSIKAYAECLEGLPDKNTERSERYIKVIIQKADELAKLSEDMFLHAISDLEKLEVTPGVYQSRELFIKILEPMMLHYDNRIVITSAIPEVDVYADPARLAQVCENILTNAAKYAPGSEIRIEASVKEDMLAVQFKDFGKGVNPEDLPFLFDKFYRGRNAKESDQAGSGLGLYICSHILGKMDGGIKAYNYYETGISGFAVEIDLKIVKEKE